MSPKPNMGTMISTISTAARWVLVPTPPLDYDVRVRRFRLTRMSEVGHPVAPAGDRYGHLKRVYD
jgi:hypothetical protein